MNIVSYGGGTNSTAMIIGMYEQQIPIDLILFADTGAEMPETYEYVKLFSAWCTANRYPEIVTVCNVDKDGNRFSLEDECHKYSKLPDIAYGWKKCSVKHKIGPQDKFCNNHPACLAEWAAGRKITKFVGYDAGEERRMTNAIAHDMIDKKYDKRYLLIEWGWWREDCVSAIERHGLPLPGKSSCFFCPSMKRLEIKALKKNHPDLFDRAIAIEQNAAEGLVKVKGLGRDFSWERFIAGEDAQIGFCGAFESDDVPCGCYDG